MRLLLGSTLLTVINFYNYFAALDFLDEDAVDDACTVLSYLCDADMLLDTHRQNFSRSNDTEGILQSCAASVAVRGVLFGNDHPVPPRFPFDMLENTLPIFIFLVEMFRSSRHILDFNYYIRKFCSHSQGKQNDRFLSG